MMFSNKCIGYVFILNLSTKVTPDDACDDPSYPWRHIDVLKEKLRQLGYDPKKAIEEAIEMRWNL